MKNLFLAVIALMGLASCQKDEVQAVLNPGAVPVVNLSTQSVVLTKENADKDALTVSWAKPDYGFAAPAAYTILFDKKGGNFANAVAISTGSDLKKIVKTAELNALLLKLGLVAGAAADVDVRVQSVLGPATTLSSVVSALKATPYLDKLDLSSIWGVVGSATTNGWNGPDQPFYKSDKANSFVAYVTLADGEIKFRQNNDWAVNLGDDKANGTLQAGGGNIVVKAGDYRITFDATALTYKIDKFTWGVIGSGTVNGWGGTSPDLPFFYDPSTDQWRAIVSLIPGEIKFRQNNDWAVNIGDDGANGTLEAGGANIVVKAGTYDVLMDLTSATKQTYKLTKK